MCSIVDKVDYEQADKDTYVFRTFNDNLTLNIVQVRQIREWCNQIIKDQDDDGDDEIVGW